MTDLFTTALDDMPLLDRIPRDRYGRPYVVTPDGNRASYQRCTTFIKAMDDNFNLERWKMRMVAIGLSTRPDLLLSAAANVDDKTELNAICESALEAGGGTSGRDIGKALHKFTQRIDEGKWQVSDVPESNRADVEAYLAAMRPFTHIDIEGFGVIDDLKVAGSWDRRVSYQGRNYIADVKTGADLAWSINTIALQLAVYAHSVAYNVNSGERDAFEVDQERALVIHLPAGTGTCELVWVDIAAGWEAVDLARQVHQWRKRKGLSSKFVDMVDVPLPPTIDEISAGCVTATLDDAIATADTYAALLALHAAHADVWTASHTQLAAARKALIEGKVA